MRGVNDTYITVNQSNLLGSDRTSQDDANSFTVETWVKIPTPLSSNVYDFLLYTSPGFPDYLFRFWFLQSSGNNVYPNFSARITYAPTGSDEMFVLGSPRTDGGYDSPPRVSLTPNQWNHIAVVGRSENFSIANKTGTCRLKMYLNGTLVGDESRWVSNKSCRFDVTGGESLFIGKKRGSLDQGFTGQVDELRITRWNRYNQNFTPPSRPFFEVSGSNDGSTLLMQFNGDFRNIWGSTNGEVTGTHYQFVDSNLIPPTPTPSPTPTPTRSPSPTPTPVLSPTPTPTSTTVRQTFQLSPGYNAIGLTVGLRTPNYLADDFLRDLNSSFVLSTGENQTNAVTNVTRFNPQTGRYEPHDLGSPVNNFTIAYGVGYLVRSTQAGTSTLTSTGFASQLGGIQVAKGWSIISIPFPDFPSVTRVQTAEDLLQAMKNQGIDVRTINRWSAGRWNTHQINSTANNFTLTPGEAYFIRNSGVAKTFSMQIAPGQ